MSRKRLLFISNLYPSPLQPHMASFNRQQVAALSRHFEIEVIAPVPWQAGWRKGSFPRIVQQEEIVAHHPIYWYTPRWGRRYYGQFFLHSIQNLAFRLNQQKAFDYVFGAWLYPDGWAASKIASKLDVPLFLKVHGTDVNRMVSGAPISALSVRAANCAQTVFCVSRALKDRLVAFGCEPDKLKVVYNGVNKEIFYPIRREEARRRLGVPVESQLILFVGNLKEAKGLGELARAFCRLKRRPDFDSLNLAIVGGGDYLSRLDAILREEGCREDVKFAGTLPLDKVALWMNAANVLCLPSYNEGVPNVILEALACGTPVVATNVGGIPELASEDGRVLLVPPRNVEPLVERLEEALNRQYWPGERLTIQSWAENAAEIAARILS